MPTLLGNLTEDFVYIFRPKTSDSETNATSIFELKVRFLKILIQYWQLADFVSCCSMSIRVVEPYVVARKSLTNWT